MDDFSKAVIKRLNELGHQKIAQKITKVENVDDEFTNESKNIRHTPLLRGLSFVPQEKMIDRPVKLLGTLRRFSKEVFEANPDHAALIKQETQNGFYYLAQVLEPALFLGNSEKNTGEFDGLIRLIHPDNHIHIPRPLLKSSHIVKAMEVLTAYKADPKNIQIFFPVSEGKKFYGMSDIPPPAPEHGVVGKGLTHIVLEKFGKIKVDTNVFLKNQIFIGDLTEETISLQKNLPMLKAHAKYVKGEKMGEELVADQFYLLYSVTPVLWAPRKWVCIHLED